jgi:hypothetical protein
MPKKLYKQVDIKLTFKHKGIALGAFLDTEGAFDRTSFDISW